MDLLKKKKKKNEETTEKMLTNFSKMKFHIKCKTFIHDEEKKKCLEM